jgi:hypothetical protein
MLSICRRSSGDAMTRRERALYLLTYRRLRTALRREMRALRAEFEIDELRDELHEARRLVERLRMRDDAIEADAGDWHELALH